MVHPPAVTDGVEESTAAGGAGVTAQQVRGAAFHQASAATRRSYEVRLVLLKQFQQRQNMWKKHESVEEVEKSFKYM